MQNYPHRKFHLTVELDANSPRALIEQTIELRKLIEDAIFKLQKGGTDQIVKAFADKHGGGHFQIRYDPEMTDERFFQEVEYIRQARKTDDVAVVEDDIEGSIPDGAHLVIE